MLLGLREARVKGNEHVVHHMETKSEEWEGTAINIFEYNFMGIVLVRRNKHKHKNSYLPEMASLTSDSFTIQGFVEAGRVL